ncbi:MAG: hypothetical protein WD052_11825 [Bacteroidales bacterium]
MIYKFRIISDESIEFARELLIDSGQTFLDFHHCLQADLGFDPKQLSSFFITNASWEKQLQITLLDMMDDENETCITMDEARLDSYIREKGQRMLYVFDFFSERSFFIELTEVIDISESKSLPKIIYASGSPPPQINLELDNLSISDEDLDDDFSTGSFDDDDFSEGFDFIDPEDFPNE